MIIIIFVIFTRVQKHSFEKKTTKTHICVYSKKKNSFQLSDKQFVWVAINARSKYNRWNEIEELFKVKVSISSSRDKNCCFDSEISKCVNDIPHGIFFQEIFTPC